MLTLSLRLLQMVSVLCLTHVLTLLPVHFIQNNSISCSEKSIASARSQRYYCSCNSPASIPRWVASSRTQFCGSRSIIKFQFSSPHAFVQSSVKRARLPHLLLVDSIIALLEIFMYFEVIPQASFNPRRLPSFWTTTFSI